MNIIVGVDISKASLDAYMTGGKTRQFSNSSAGFHQLMKWAEKADTFVMEATGAYHFALADALCDAGKRVCVVNPRWASHYAKAMGLCHKTDRVDAKVLALYAERNEAPVYVPLPTSQRRLKKLARHRERLVQDATRLKRILQEPDIEPLEARQIKDQIKLLQDHVGSVEREIHELIDQDEELLRSYTLLRTIPGMGEVTTLTVLAEAGDLRRFQSAKHLASFTGVHPRLVQSGTSIHMRPRMCKTGCAGLRRALYMSALSAIRSEGPCRQLFLRLVESGKSRKSALGAVMHKQIRLAYGVCYGNRPFSSKRTDLTTA